MGLDEQAARAAKGDASAFAEIVRSTAPRLFRLAARLTCSEAEAEDVLQDGYMKAWDALREGRFDGRSSLETWLYRIVLNTALNARRSTRRTRPIADAAERTAHGSAEASAALTELAGWVGDLPEEQRTAFILKYVEDLTTLEIAELLGCTEGAVEQRLVRARAALRAKGQA